MNEKRYEFINFRKLTDTHGGKPQWRCANNRTGDELGVVHWHAPWRQYCYFPTYQAVYSKGCMNDICDFIDLVSA